MQTPFVCIFNRGNRKFVHFKPRFYRALDASCWQPYWILYRSPIVVYNYGSEKTIRGRIFVWPAIFQGINGTMDKHSNPERRIRVCLAMLNNLNFLLTLQSKTSVQKKQKCNQPNSHQGRCDSSITFHAFWKSLSSHVALKRKGELQEQNKWLSLDIETKKARLDEFGNIITLSVFETCKKFHFYHHATLKFERK